MATYSNILAWRIPHGEGSLVGYSPWDCKELDRTEQLSTAQHSAEKLNKQHDNTQPLHTPFPIWSQCIVPCPVLTVAS